MLQVYDEVESNLEEEFLNQIYNATLKHFGFEDCFDVEVTIVDEETILQLNTETRNIAKVTDVLSYPGIEMKFPFVKEDYKDDINYETGNIMLGEIVLCEKRAIEQANEYGHSYHRECGYLVLHGLLHLLGFDHMVEEDKVVMRKHEEEILLSLGIERE